MSGTIHLSLNLFGRLAGPILDKELRVASRRGRTYLLRFGYIVLLSLFLIPSILAVSIGTSSAAPSSVVQTSLMGMVALTSVVTIVWFQFLMGQLLAVVLLSGAIGDEIRKRSLDALLVSPISSLQIVLGKLFSRLLQLVLLLAVGLPLLAVIRAFGGVPWGQVFSAICVTLTATVVTGSVSLFLSATNRNSQNVAVGAIAWCTIMWMGIPGMFALLRWKGYVGSSAGEVVSYLGSPFIVLWHQTMTMTAPGSSPMPPSCSWSLHCLLMLAVALVISVFSVRRVRRTALSSVAGGHEGEQDGQGGSVLWSRFRRRTVRRIRGSPIIWREAKRPVLARGRRGAVQAVLLTLAICGALAALAYLLLSVNSEFGSVCATAAAILELVFAYNVASSAASSIAREKEGRTLEVLLTIPSHSGAIIRGKAIGILRRNLPLLIPIPLLGLLAYLTAGSDSQMNDLLGVLQSEIGLVADVAFLMGLGFCLSAYLRTTVSAIVLTFGVFVASKVVVSTLVVFLPFFALRVFSTYDSHRIRSFMFIAGVVQAIIYAGLGIILGVVAARALRPNCQK